MTPKSYFIQNDMPTLTQYEYMPACAEHISQICDIERLSFSEPWSPESIEREFGDSLARYFVAVYRPGGETGCARVAGYCGYWSVVGEAHITNIAVHPEHRGHGVGAGLIKAMQDDIIALGHSSATLEVREDNGAAIRLYERHGFERAGRRKKYYDHGKKDALIMWKIFI